MNKIKSIIIILTGLLLFNACENEPFEPVVGTYTAPVLSSTLSDGDFTLEEGNADDVLATVSWSKADFGFQSATTYTLLIDQKDSGFIAAKKLVTTTDTSFQILTGKLNTVLLSMGVSAGNSGAIELKVTAKINDAVQTLESTVISFTASPYEEGTYPSIYMIGAATGGWDPALAVEVASTGEPNKYYTTAYFDVADGTNFRFFTNPDWGSSLGGYDVFTTYPSDLLEPATGEDDPNFNFIGTPGWYVINADTDAGTITMEETTEPVMYITGDATHGWDWDAPLTTLYWTGHEIWEGDVDFIQDGAFRFFPQADWGPVSYGYDVFENFDTDYIIIAEDHGDPNWYFVAPSGNYHVVLDMRKASVIITAN